MSITANETRLALPALTYEPRNVSWHVGVGVQRVRAADMLCIRPRDALRPLAAANSQGEGEESLKERCRKKGDVVFTTSPMSPSRALL